jgi:hypothetical protein
MSVMINWNDEVLAWENFVYVDGVAYRKDLPPATAGWYRCKEKGEVHFLVATCPCGCGAIMRPPVKAGSEGWSWNQDLVKPTLAPSIRMLTGCGWHGFLTDGEFRSC